MKLKEKREANYCYTERVCGFLLERMGEKKNKGP